MFRRYTIKKLKSKMLLVKHYPRGAIKIIKKKDSSKPENAIVVMT